MNKVEELYCQLNIILSELKREASKLPFIESELFLSNLRLYIYNLGGFILHKDEVFIKVLDYKEKFEFDEYLISNYGKIFDTREGVLLNLTVPEERKYTLINLRYKDNKKYKFALRKVHQLVAFSFMDKFEEIPLVRHLHSLDGVRERRKKRKVEINEFCEIHSEERFIKDKINEKRKN